MKILNPYLGKLREDKRKLLHRAVFVTSALMVGGALVSFLTSDATAGWWDEGWAYRKQINFGNSGSAQSNKIISFTEDTATLITGGKMQSQCQDIRFVDTTGRTLEHRIGYQPEIQYVPGSATEYNSTTGASSYTFSHTVNSGSNQLLTVIVHAQDTAAINVTNVTFNSDSMTEQIEVDNNDGTNHYVTSIWTLVNPDVTSANVQVTYSASVDRHVASAMNFTGVDQTTPVGAVESNTTSSASNIEITDTTSYANSLLVGGGLRKVNETSPSRRLYTQLPGKHVYEERTGTTTSNISAGGGFQYAQTPGSQTMTFGLSDATSNTYMNGAFIEIKQEAGCNSDSTDIDVLIPNIVSGENTVYMYYGNPAADDATSSLINTSNPVTYKEYTDANNTSSGTISYTHSVTSGDNQTLVVVVDQAREQAGESPGDVTSVTYKSKPLVRQAFVDAHSTNRNNSTEVWTLINPDTGSNQVVVNLDSAAVIVSAAMTIENTRQNYVPIAGASAQSAGSSFDINIATTKPNTLLAGGGARHYAAATPNATTTNVSVSSPGVEVYDERKSDGDATSSVSSAGGYQGASSPGSHTMNLSATAGTVWTGALVALEPESSYDTFSPTSGPTAVGEEKGPGPVGYWKFDEGTGTDAFDSTSTQNHGTISGASWQTASSCIFGPCLLFDGSNDVVTIANNDTIDFDKGLKTGVSVSFWVNPSSDGEGDNGRIFTKGSHLYCRTDSQSGGAVDLECTIDLATSDATVNIAGGLTTGVWHHVEITYGDDGDDDLLVYINGQLKGTGNGSGAPVGTDTSPLLIGGDTTTNYHGYVDDFKIFDYERTADQVKTDYIIGASASGSSVAVGIGGTPMPDPIVWWRFDETNSSTANNSISSYSSLSGTITNAVWKTDTNCRISSCLLFDGSGDYVSTPDAAALDITGDFTLSAWVNRTSGGGGTRAVITKFNVATPSGGYKLAVGNAGEVYCLTANGGSWIESYTPQGLVTTTSGWTHIAAVRSGSTCRVYVNGLDRTATFATHTTLTANSEAFRVGSSSDGQQYFYGYIDDVKAYNTALTADQVKVDYNATSALNAGTGINERSLHASGDSYMDNLYAYWSFDENTGTGSDFAKDYSGNNRPADSSSTVIWAPGVYGSAVDFNNSWYLLDYTTSNFNPGTSDFTYMGWYYIDSKNTSAMYLVGKQADSSYGYSFWFTPSNNNLKIRLNENGYYGTIATTDTILDDYQDKWAHYAAVYDRDGLMSLYINGTLQASADISSNSSANITNAGYHVLGSSAGVPMYGKLDEYKFFMSALTPAQIGYEYNRGAPLAWYRLDECQGTTINDATGNGFTGTLTVGSSGTYTAAGTCSSGTSTHAWNAGTTGKMSSAMAFDGTDDYIDTLSSALMVGKTEGTVQAWVNVASFDGTQNMIYSENIAGGVVFNLSQTADDKLSFNIRQPDATVRRVDTGTIPLSTNTWYHVSGAFNASAGYSKLYLNGILVDENTDWDGAFSTPVTQVSIGRATNVGNYYFNGKIDDVRIYNYELSEAQVRATMNGGAMRME